MEVIPSFLKYAESGFSLLHVSFVPILILFCLKILVRQRVFEGHMRSFACQDAFTFNASAQDVPEGQLQRS